MIVIFTNLYILYIGMISGYQMSINKELDFAFVFVRRKPLLILANSRKRLDGVSIDSQKFNLKLKLDLKLWCFYVFYN